MELALQKGYANYHDWIRNNDGCINVVPIRELPKFKELISNTQRYSIKMKKASV